MIAVTFDEIVAGVAGEGGFDVSAAMLGGWVNEVHGKAVAESQWQTESLSLGVTVADQAVYSVPDRVVDVRSIYLNDGSEAGQPSQWTRVSVEDLWDLNAGRRGLKWSGGVFAPSFSSVGVQGIELYPPPITAGVPITALAACLPATMVSGMSPVIPADMHGDLKDGAIALGLLRIDERPDAAAAFEVKFERMVAKLRRRKNSRIGSGASRMKAKGYDF